MICYLAKCKNTGNFLSVYCVFRMPRRVCGVFVAWVVANSFLFSLLYTKISPHCESISQNLHQTLIQEQHKEQLYKTILKDYNNTRLQELWNNVPVLDAPNLPRLMTTFHLEYSLKLLDEVTKFFDKHNIEYIMCYGTLLGSYVAHSVLAWDDDIDIVIHARHQRSLEKLIDGGLLSDIGISHLIDCFKVKENDESVCARPKNKFWFTDSHWGTHRQWLNPFVDVILYNSNNTHVWLLNEENLHVLPIETFYPLQRRPLNGRWLYAPREPYAFLVANYMSWDDYLDWEEDDREETDGESDNRLTCSWPKFNHWAELYFERTRKADCETLLAFYPFVQRSKSESGETIEDLILDNITYYSIVTSETFLENWQPQLHRLTWFEHWPMGYLE